MKETRTEFNPHTQSLTPNRLALAFSFVAVATSPLLMAQDDNKYDLSSNWYGGINIGKTRENINDGDIANSELNGTLTGFSDDKRDEGFKIFAGYQFNDTWALEAGYFELGEFGFNATQVPTGSLTNTTKTRGINIDVVGSVPIRDRWSAFARLGAHYSESKDRFQSTGAVVLSDDYRRERDTYFKWGGGLQYDFTQRFSMRAEVERYQIDDVIGRRGAINLLSVGAVYRFGSSRPARDVEEPVTRRDQLREEYCTTLDIKFAIDSADIQSEGIEQLITVGNFLKKYNDSSAMIEGHTDDVGSDEYNMDLSQRRAESAMNYLVQEQGVSGRRISAKGFGETRPVASNETEEGKRENRRVTASVTCVEDVAGMAPPKARVTMGSSIEFDNNSTTVASRYHNELAKVASFLKDNPNVTAVIEGHAADSQASSTNARDISLKRAQNVMDYLANQQGVERSRLRAEAYGKSRRIAYNDTAEGKQQNRRVNIIFTYPQGSASPVN